MSSYEKAACFYSKYCNRAIRIGSGGKLGEQLLETVAVGEYDVLIPVGLEACRESARLKTELEARVRVPVAPHEAMEIAARKHRTMQLAQDLGIRAPLTAALTSLEQATSFAQEIGFPMVIKWDIGSGGRGVSFPHNEDELASAVRAARHSRLLLQEYVPGTGFGYSALLRDGNVLAEFMHQRIHEYPPGGGPSTMARSIEDARMREASKALLRRLRWTGVVMVEFRGAPISGDLRLLEINPKFWGSLDLAIASGVDFPDLLLRMVLGEEVSQSSYAKGVVFRWVYPDLLHALETHGLVPYLARFLDRATLDDLDMSDPGPVALTARRILGRLRQGLSGPKARSPIPSPAAI
jgi:predicted ATP-grasp superfamily ATP-dependent carboligase